MARLYREVGPNQALLVFGLGGTHVYSGRGAVVWPMIQSAKELSLELMSFDVAPQQDLYTKQGVAVTVEAVAQIGFTFHANVAMNMNWASVSALKWSWVFSSNENGRRPMTAGCAMVVTNAPMPTMT